MMIDMRGLRVIQITALTEVICTSAVGFMRWTCGQYMKFACAYTSGRTNEAWDETETRLIKLCILQRRVFMLLIVFACFSIALYWSVLDYNTHKIFIKNHPNILEESLTRI